MTGKEQSVYKWCFCGFGRKKPRLDDKKKMFESQNSIDYYTPFEFSSTENLEFRKMDTKWRLAMASIRRFLKVRIPKSYRKTQEEQSNFIHFSITDSAVDDEIIAFDLRDHLPYMVQDEEQQDITFINTFIPVIASSSIPEHCA
ncbi:hypothetical protein Ciccas_000284 [Cichlidogyrus casuarinus]|uniref:Uncharacterized protein n=1 Tax=Cichlidogyrus casuarinus TaxID=1844966 RepID=A0ABD2QNC9_9PLAT